MIDTRGLLRAYGVVDNELSSKESRARTSKRRTYWSQMRMLNDHAYFMLVFARFERHIDDRCTKLVTSRRLTKSWRRRRFWDDFDVERAAFMRKVALLTDKSGATFSRVQDIYKNVRNPIAHGDSWIVGPILLPSLAQELRSISARLL